MTDIKGQAKGRAFQQCIYCLLLKRQKSGGILHQDLNATVTNCLSTYIPEVADIIQIIRPICVKKVDNTIRQRILCATGQVHIQLFNADLLCQVYSFRHGTGIAMSNIGIKVCNTHFIIQMNGIPYSIFCCNTIELLGIQLVEQKLRKIQIQFHKIQAQLTANLSAMADRFGFDHGGHSQSQFFHVLLPFQRIPSPRPIIP